MTKIIYEVVEHDGGWAYRANGVSPRPSARTTSPIVPPNERRENRSSLGMPR